MSVNIIEILSNFQNILDKISKVRENSNNIVSNESDIICNLELIIKTIFDSISKGKYVRYRKEIQEALYKVIQEEDIDDNLYESKYIISICEICKLYDLFIEEYYHFIGNPNTYIKKPYSYKDNDIILLFNYYIEIEIIDIHFSDNKYTYDRLQSIGVNINNITNENFLYDYKEKILKKINFLIYKWIKRAELNDIKIDDVDFGNIDKLPEWSEEINYIKDHYTGNEGNIKTKIKLLSNKEIKDYTAKEFHLSIKYYKDICPDLDKLKYIVDTIKDKKDKNTEDKRAWNIIYDYAKNNYFSLFVEECEEKDSILEEYERIKSNTKNYFAQYKVLDRIIQIINQGIHNNKDKESINSMYDFFEKKLELIYQEYRSNTLWSLEYSGVIFCLPYEESKINDIYFHSGFMLPPSNIEAKNIYDKIEREYEALNIIIKSLHQIIPRIEELKETESKIEGKIKKTEIKSIEIVSLFTAVISFIIGGIQGFGFVNNIYAALAFVSMFSISLISFLLVLLLITRHDESILKKHWIPISVVYGVLVSVMLFGLYKIDTDTKKQNGDIEKESRIKTKIPKEEKSQVVDKKNKFYK